MTAPYRVKDLANVQESIRALELPLAFRGKLNPSVSGEYEQLWNTVNVTIDPYDEKRMLQRR